MLFLFVLTLHLGAVACEYASHHKLCHDVHFSVSATAQNRVAKDPPKDTYPDPAAIASFLSQPVEYQNISGTFDIHGQLCTPQGPSKDLRLQILVHGSTYNHTYWSGLEDPSNPVAIHDNSWIHYATNRGYYTLAIDRLGSGNSDHPDPVNVVQDPLQTEILHKIVALVRTNDVLEIGFSPRYGRVTYVGHSYGSGLGVHLVQRYPGAIDALVLTGMAVVGGNPGPGASLNHWAQASEVFPDRFPPDVFSPGYLVATNKTGRRDNYYSEPGRDFNPNIYEKDWAGEVTSTFGEQLTVAEYLVQLPKNYARPVFVTTGSEDALFCSANGSRALGPADCGTGEQSQIAKTRPWFAGVPDGKFKAFVQPNAGHAQQLHYSAKETFEAVHDWLDDMV